MIIGSTEYFQDDPADKDDHTNQCTQLRHIGQCIMHSIDCELYILLIGNYTFYWLAPMSSYYEPPELIWGNESAKGEMKFLRRQWVWIPGVFRVNWINFIAKCSLFFLFIFIFLLHCVPYFYFLSMCVCVCGCVGVGVCVWVCVSVGVGVVHEVYT